jgi:hypothetical protein
VKDHKIELLAQSTLFSKQNLPKNITYAMGNIWKPKIIVMAMEWDQSTSGEVKSLKYCGVYCFK